ncbi:hypothetical protein ETAA8_62240 [Anatilimnocola aggregata]|uniref:DUF1365 domain-containing protein n=1 Tax=Anatilimnocola aggregata TaxID=2528021 RepID=A0A517YLH4_9BACT|nr:DUF1365 domain-containing protein [Anatilimnocola aggregata]QDU31071.1 hypothetical protein ETAA8_62240 [Anatilimnocola aggregata]
MHSSLYEGTVWHRRDRPVIHQFQYRQFMLYLDLDEIPALAAAGIFARETHLATASFCLADHPVGEAGSNEVTLKTAVSDLVRERTGLHITGPIRLLTHLRFFGYYFSPLNLYYCFDPREELQCVVAEVSNIPWRERHWYVLWSGNQTSTEFGRFRHEKQFHVSPFLSMQQQYRWLIQPPGEQLKVSLRAELDDQPILTAVQSMRRRELTRASLAAAMIRQGWMSAKVVAAIYYQAFWLWRKQLPVYSHPKESQPCPTTQGL